MRSLHVKLTGAMLLVMALDAAGYLLAVSHVHGEGPLRVILEDTFVAVAILTISVGLILPGMIANSVSEVSDAANRLATRTVADLTRAMQALGRGDLAAAHARTDIEPVRVHSRDEVGRMAESFNLMQVGIANAARTRTTARFLQNAPPSAAVAPIASANLNSTSAHRSRHASRNPASVSPRWFPALASPRGGGALPLTLPCGVRTFLGGLRRRDRRACSACLF